jgi:hypothetical protein
LPSAKGRSHLAALPQRALILVGNPRRMAAMVGDIGCDRDSNRHARTASAITFSSTLKC